DIGGLAPATGNIITNWGNGAILSAFSTVTLTGLNGIYLNYQVSDNTSYNTITSAAVNITITFRGIYHEHSVTAPVGTFTSTLSNNTITLSNAATSGSTQGVVNFGGNSTETLNITNNNVINCANTGVATAA